MDVGSGWCPSEGAGGGILAQSITQPVARTTGAGALTGKEEHTRQPGWAGRSHPNHSDVGLPRQGLFDVSVCSVAMGPGRRPMCVSQGDLPGGWVCQGPLTQPPCPILGLLDCMYLV